MTDVQFNDNAILKNLTSSIRSIERDVTFLNANVPKAAWKAAELFTRMHQRGREIDQVTRAIRSEKLTVNQLHHMTNISLFDRTDNPTVEVESIDQVQWSEHNETKQFVHMVLLTDEAASDTRVHEVVGIGHWDLEATKPVYKKYVGPKYVVANYTANCTIGIAQPRTQHIYERCDQTNFQDPKLSLWEDHHVWPGKARPELHRTKSCTIVYCLYHQIEIRNETLDCPPFPFRIPLTTPFSLTNVTQAITKSHEKVIDRGTVIQPPNIHAWVENYNPQVSALLIRNAELTQEVRQALLDKRDSGWGGKLNWTQLDLPTIGSLLSIIGLFFSIICCTCARGQPQTGLNQTIMMPQ